MIGSWYSHRTYWVLFSYKNDYWMLSSLMCSFHAWFIWYEKNIWFIVLPPSRHGHFLNGVVSLFFFFNIFVFFLWKKWNGVFSWLSFIEFLPEHIWIMFVIATNMMGFEQTELMAKKWNMVKKISIVSWKSIIAVISTALIKLDQAISIVS